MYPQRVHGTDRGAVVSQGGTDTQQAAPDSARQQSANDVMLAERRSSRNNLS